MIFTLCLSPAWNVFTIRRLDIDGAALQLHHLCMLSNCYYSFPASSSSSYRSDGRSGSGNSFVICSTYRSISILTLTDKSLTQCLKCTFLPTVSISLISSPVKSLTFSVPAIFLILSASPELVTQTTPLQTVYRISTPASSTSIPDSEESCLARRVRTGLSGPPVG